MALLAVHSLLAVCLVALGRWGRENAAALVTPCLPEKDQRRKARTVRRGGFLCYLVAGGLVAVALAALAA